MKEQKDWKDIIYEKFKNEPLPEVFINKTELQEKEINYNMKGSYWLQNTKHGAFLTDKNDFIGYKLIKYGVWEPEIIKIYEFLIQPHYVIVDIGAHMGFHTINFAKRGLQVYSFEPQKHLYNQVCGNIFLNDLNEKVICFNIGLGETSKQSSFGSINPHNTLNWEGNTGLELINYGGRSLEDNLNTNEIEIRTLDSFNLSPNFIKIDVEGYELKTFQGAYQTLKNNKPVILFESFPDFQPEVFKFLNNIGYEIWSIFQEDNFVALHPQFKEYNNIKNKFKNKWKITHYK